MSIDEYNQVTGIEDVHGVFRRWLGQHYELTALDAVVSAAAAERLDGDPPWLLLVSGPGNAKTETVMSLSGVTKHVISAISSDAALLSGTPAKERAKDATGGLLRAIGDHGLLVIKDFTSIIGMDRKLRDRVMTALREIHDGSWTRDLGTEGGRSLQWKGRLVLIGAVTTAYDSAYSVIQSMGDRFALLRMDSGDSAIRQASHRQAMANVGSEKQMREELADVVTRLLGCMDPSHAKLLPEDADLLGDLANVVTLARTAVTRDYRGDVIDAEAPEMPTRFAKMLGQIVRGGLAVGMGREHAVSVAIKIAGDSCQPLRMAILGDLLENPESNVTAIRKRLEKPHNTVDRECQALHMLGLVRQDDTSGSWRYTLSDHVDTRSLSILISRNVTTPYL